MLPYNVTCTLINVILELNDLLTILQQELHVIAIRQTCVSNTLVRLLRELNIQHFWEACGLS